MLEFESQNGIPRWERYSTASQSESFSKLICSASTNSVPFRIFVQCFCDTHFCLYGFNSQLASYAWQARCSVHISVIFLRPIFIKYSIFFSSKFACIFQSIKYEWGMCRNDKMKNWKNFLKIDSGKALLCITSDRK